MAVEAFISYKNPTETQFEILDYAFIVLPLG